MKKIIITGSLNVDMVISAPYCPQGGETLTGSGFTVNCGGKGANQATACAKLGGIALMCGCTGSDGFGDRLIGSLNSAGVDTKHVRKTSSAPTGTAVILVTQGQNRIVLDRGANALLCKADIDGALAAAHAGDFYLTQLENTIDMIGYGLRRAKQAGLITILNPAPADRAIEAYFPYVDYIVPNESELELFGGRDRLLSCGIRNVITTLGADGYEYATAEGAKRYPCKRVRAEDTTGAGDTFCGGMAAMLARGESLEQAMAFASAAASLACTRKGAAASIPTYEETVRFLLEA